MENELKLKDYPIMGWLFGVGAIGFAAYQFLSAPTAPQWFPIGLGMVVGSLMLVLNYGLTITADRQAGVLTLDYRSLLLHSVKEIYLDEIAFIRVDKRISRNSKGGHSNTYCIVADLKSGGSVPFRSYYASGSWGKQKIVDQLRAFLRMPEGFDATPQGIFRAAPQMGAAIARAQQQEFTGGVGEMRVTNGVNWTLQPIGIGATPATRWFSPDFKTRGGFLYLAQKVAGQPSGGVFASLTNTLFKQSMTLYGFSASDTPNLAAAGAYPGVSAALDAHFIAFTSDPAEARQILNPWMQNPLAAWGARYPLKQFQSAGPYSQIAILYSPNGVYIATPTTLNSEQLEELTALGVELVKSQGM